MRTINHRSGIVKVIIIVVLAALVGAAYLFMTQEQTARTASEQGMTTLGDAIDAGEQYDPEKVREVLKRDPNESRTPFKNRLVEEYIWKGPISSHTVYAYYSVAAIKILEAVSLNKKLDDWETQKN